MGIQVWKVYHGELLSNSLSAVKLNCLVVHFYSVSGENGRGNNGTNGKVSKNSTFSILGFGGLSLGLGFKDLGFGFRMRSLGLGKLNISVPLLPVAFYRAILPVLFLYSLHHQIHSYF